MLLIERAFYPAHISSPDADRLLYERIAGTAAKHAPGGRENAAAIAAIAELAEAAGGRADLLAKCAGLALG